MSIVFHVHSHDKNIIVTHITIISDFQYFDDLQLRREFFDVDCILLMFVSLLATSLSIDICSECSNEVILGNVTRREEKTGDNNSICIRIKH